VGTAVLITAAASAHAAEMEDLRLDFGPVGARGELAGELTGLAATDDGLVIPELLAGESEGAYLSEAIEAPISFTAVGPHWIADTPEGTSFTLELATSPDGVEWGPFHVVQVDSHLVPTEFFPDGTPNPNFGHTMGGLRFRSQGDGAWVRYRAVLRSDAGVTATPVLRHLTLTFIDSSARPAIVETDAGQSLQNEPQGMYAKPPVNSRSAWGAIPGTCSYSYCNVTHVATHHTAGVGEYSCSGFDDCAADVRAIQNFHMFTNGWCDLGYNYLVSSDGQLWEGRGGGDDVVGAHDSQNCGSMGVSNMGFYHTPHNHVWTEAQLEAEAELAAWKADQKGIDPFGVSFYAGLGANMDNFYGHRDVGSTACPGDNIYDRLDELKARVDEKLNGGGCAPDPIANAGSDKNSCPGEPVQIGTAAQPDHTYSWSPGGQTDAQITVSPEVDTTYTVTATTSCGSATDTVTVDVDDENCGCNTKLSFLNDEISVGESLEFRFQVHHNRPANVTIPVEMWIEDQAGNVVVTHETAPVHFTFGDTAEINRVQPLPGLAAGKYKMIARVHEMLQGVARVERVFTVVE